MPELIFDISEKQITITPMPSSSIEDLVRHAQHMTLHPHDRSQMNISKSELTAYEKDTDGRIVLKSPYENPIGIKQVTFTYGHDAVLPHFLVTAYIGDCFDLYKHYVITTINPMIESFFPMAREGTKLKKAVIQEETGEASCYCDGRLLHTSDT